MGLTTSGTIGAATALSLDDCVPRVAAIAQAAREVRDDVIVLCHGGPIAMPDDAAFMLQRVPMIRWILRRQFHGATAHRDRVDRTGP